MKKAKYIIPLILICTGLILFITGFILYKNSVGTKNIETTEVSYDFVYSDEAFGGIKINSEAADIVILKGNEFSVECGKIVENNLSVKYEGGILNIDYKAEKWFGFLSFGAITDNIKAGYITVTVPGENIETLDINGGVGTVELRGFNIERAEIDVGVGEYLINNCKFTESLDIKTGVGEIEVLNCEIAGLRLDNGVGSSEFERCLLNDGAVIKNGVGSVSMELVGSSYLYDIYVENGLGEVSINDKDITSSPYVSNHGGPTISIENGVGDVEIDFDEWK